MSMVQESYGGSGMSTARRDLRKETRIGQKGESTWPRETAELGYCHCRVGLLPLPTLPRPQQAIIIYLLILATVRLSPVSFVCDDLGSRPLLSRNPFQACPNPA